MAKKHKRVQLSEPVTLPGNAGNYAIQKFQSTITQSKAKDGKAPMPVTLQAVPGLPTADGGPINATTKGGPKANIKDIFMRRYSVTGTQRFGGYPWEEYLTKLQGRNGILKYDEMFRSDPQVFTAVMRGNNKIKAAKFYVAPPEKDKKDPKKIERASQIQYALFEGTDKIWLENLNDILTYRRFGFAAFEPVWENIEHPEFGLMTTLKSYGWINPKTIWQIFVVNDQPYSVRQISYGDDYRYIDVPATAYIEQKDSKGKIRQIPWPQVLFFTNLREGNNFEGISSLRPMFKPYLVKEASEQINALGIENNARGITNVTIDTEKIGSVEDEDVEKAIEEAVLANVPYRKWPKGYEAKYERTDYQATAVLDTMRFQDASISKVTQTDQMEMGLTSQTGSRSAHSSKEESEEVSLKNDAQYICDKLNLVIKMFEYYNWGEMTGDYKVKYIGVDIKPNLEDAQKIGVLTQWGYISPANPVQRAYVCEHFGVPGGAEIEDAEEDETEGKDKMPKTAPAVKPLQPPTGNNNIEPKPNDNETQLSEKKGKFWRELTKYEKKINLAEIDKKFDDLGDEYNLIAKKWLKAMRDKFKEDLTRELKSATTERQKHSAIVDMDLSYKSDYTKDIKSFMIQACVAGRKQAKQEVNSKIQLAEIPKVDELPAGVYGWVIAKTKWVVKNQTDKLNNTMTGAAQNALTKGKSDDQVVYAGISAGDDFINNENNLGGNYIPVMSVNEGRYSMFMEYKNELQGFQYSAILDESTCSLCEELDGKTLSIDDPNVDETPPLHPQCRCILIPITKDEEAPEWTGIKADQKLVDRFQTLAEKVS
jgi:hypothetical protein